MSSSASSSGPWYDALWAHFTVQRTIPSVIHCFKKISHAASPGHTTYWHNIVEQASRTLPAESLRNVSDPHHLIPPPQPTQHWLFSVFFSHKSSDTGWVASRCIVILSRPEKDAAFCLDTSYCQSHCTAQHTRYYNNKVSIVLGFIFGQSPLNLYKM